ncbi:MAG: DegT/DnrJ/EryC1/StrS family aminotransferase [Desulfobacteraceae bacterium]|nr:DegT/DnrJ/EryC1/StrS family aminotransferase [Desulfobacteraceae bacterium]MBC2752826.1 DegT/DnrJ/EryC1/StrS family aminotransferase [Desulfobacteraceae bacterium]
MKFVDLDSQQRRIRFELERRILAVLDHGHYVLGPEIEELESRLGAYVGVSHALACASGTDALLMALMAYEIGPGDAVFTTPFSFFATAEVISLLGATPVFVDIDKSSFNIDPVFLETAIRDVANDERTHPVYRSMDATEILIPKAIIAVDLFGLPANYPAINDIANNHGLVVIEDAAQSFGAELNGQKACALADIACTSFYPAKPLGCYGDGGMCFTNDDRMAEMMRSIRIHGMGDHQYDNVRVGINGRLDTMQAAVLLSKFEIFPEEVILRNTAAKRYNDLIGSSSKLTIPMVPENAQSAWAQYSLLAESEAQRDKLRSRLNQDNIPTAIYYPKPLHLQKVFEPLGYHEGDFPVSESCTKRIFSLPMHPYITAQEQEKVAGALNSIGIV